MTRLEKCIALKEKGYTYDKDTGKIFGVYGKEITNKHKNGYISIKGGNISKSNLLGHHFAWFMTYGNVDFEMLDHINRIKNDNRISNLRIATPQENQHNRDDKGYCFDKSRNKFMCYIKLNGKQINLGRYNTEEEAKMVYKEAKKKYHTI